MAAKHSRVPIGEGAPLHGCGRHLKLAFEFGDARGRARGIAPYCGMQAHSTLRKRRRQAPHFYASATHQPHSKKDGWGPPCKQAGAIRRGGKRAFFRKVSPSKFFGAKAGSRFCARS